MATDYDIEIPEGWEVVKDAVLQVGDRTFNPHYCEWSNPLPEGAGNVGTPAEWYVCAIRRTSP